jgi:hypothetical protein
MDADKIAGGGAISVQDDYFEKLGRLKICHHLYHY